MTDRLAAVTLRLLHPSWHPTFVDLPWVLPLEEWQHPRLVDAPLGIHRHVVRFVDYQGRLYVLKELGRRPAMKEFRLLRRLNELGLPVVLMVGIAERPGLDPIVITRFLNHALPYRYVIAESGDARTTGEVVRSIAALLAQLHVTGFSWGDCSLSNSMVRRDAGRLSAYALDTETGEMHARLTDGQREADLAIAHENIAGGFADLAASGELPEDVDPFDLADAFVVEYRQVWDDLYRDRPLPGEGPISLTALHELGFEIIEARVELDGSGGGSLTPLVIGEGHHRRDLHSLTGLVTREEQARLLLEDIRRAHPELELERAAHQWLHDTYDTILAAIPAPHRSKLEPAQLVLEVLAHRRAVAPAGREMSPAEAASDYVAELQNRRDERAIVEP